VFDSRIAGCKIEWLLNNMVWGNPDKDIRNRKNTLCIFLINGVFFMVRWLSWYHVHVSCMYPACYITQKGKRLKPVAQRSTSPHGGGAHAVHYLRDFPAIVLHALRTGQIFKLPCRPVGGKACCGNAAGLAYGLK
jgi:hypothetical protein